MNTRKRTGLLLLVAIAVIVSVGWMLKDKLLLLAGSVSVTVDGSVIPFVREIRGFDDEAPRPLAAVTDGAGATISFVENELIVMTDDDAAVTALAARWGGKVVRHVVLRTAGVEGPSHHLIRIDPRRADASQLDADLEALNPGKRGRSKIRVKRGWPWFGCRGDSRGGRRPRRWHQLRDAANRLSRSEFDGRHAGCTAPTSQSVGRAVRQQP